MFALPYINGLTDLWYKLFRLVDIDWVILALYVQLFKSLSRRILISYKTRELQVVHFVQTIGMLLKHYSFYESVNKIKALWDCREV